MLLHNVHSIAMHVATQCYYAVYTGDSVHIVNIDVNSVINTYIKCHYVYMQCHYTMYSVIVQCESVHNVTIQ